MTCRQQHREHGSVSVELVLITPLLLVLVLVVVYTGRLVHVRLQLESAASQAARAASLTRDQTSATQAATDTARATLDELAISCASLDVATDVSAHRPGGQVTVRLVCAVGQDHLAGLPVPAQRTITAEATSAVDRWRDTESAAS